MTREEIEKAIENGESVWYLFGEVYELKTSEHTNKFISRSGDYCYTDNNGVDRCAPLDMLYKSKEEAEHYLNHQDITRTEILPFLTWEEFLREESISFVSAEGFRCCLYYSKVDDMIYLDKGYEIDTYGATEENFYKIYDECVRLFGSEE